MESMVPPPSHHARILTHFFGSRDAAAHYLIRTLQGPRPTTVDREHLREVLRVVVRQWVSLCRRAQWAPYIRHVDDRGTLIVAFCGSVRVVYLTRLDPDDLHGFFEYGADYSAVVSERLAYAFYRRTEDRFATTRVEVEW